MRSTMHHHTHPYSKTSECNAIGKHAVKAPLPFADVAADAGKAAASVEAPVS